MKKVLCLLLALGLIALLTACNRNATDNTTTTTSAKTTEATTTTALSDGTTDASQTTTEATKGTTTATKVKANPKTDFKFGTYEATYFDKDNQAYHEIRLYFHATFETVECSAENFYTIEQLKKKYEGWGIAFDPHDFSYEWKKSIDGVTYYNIGDYSSFPEAYSLTDKNITVGQCVFSLYQDGTLVVDQANGAWYAQDGLVFTFAD